MIEKTLLIGIVLVMLFPAFAFAWSSWRQWRRERWFRRKLDEYERNYQKAIRKCSYFGDQVFVDDEEK